ncbi:MAG TPA: putative sugar nucleotidyl transferase [Flavisolibacter sp.]
MKKIVFTEEFCSPENLFPFTLTRQIQDIRVGILTIREKWESLLQLPSFDKQEGDYKDLERAIELDPGPANDLVYLVHGNVIPTPEVGEEVRRLAPGEYLNIPGGENFVYCLSQAEIMGQNKLKVIKARESKAGVQKLEYPWQIFQLNAWAIELDFRMITKDRTGSRLSDTNRSINTGHIFLEEGAVVEHCLLNASEGPIYIGKNAQVMEGSMLRGPIAIGEGSTVKMGAKIYGGTTVGPYCIVGGELKNSVLFAHSNKAHDGYLGDSVIGEWCNLGAGTSNSNVKNNAALVEVYTPSGLKSVGLKCGVLMGDYSRTAINTSINTGTVIGACCNVFGNGLTPKYIPSFSWGAEGIKRYDLNKALEHISNWKGLKEKEITPDERSILEHVFNHY